MQRVECEQEEAGNVAREAPETLRAASGSWNVFRSGLMD